MNKCKHCNSSNTVLEINKVSSLITHHKVYCNQCSKSYHIEKRNENLETFSNIKFKSEVDKNKLNTFFE
jgi:protein-arginine kinase activator protein McsA